MKKLFVYSILFLVYGNLISCNSGETASVKPSDTKVASTEKSISPQTAVSNENSVSDGPTIASLETNDFVLKIHKVIPFTLKPKSYQPFKVDPSTKLVVLDVSVRNKLSTPLDFARILGMTVLKGKGDKNLMAPWVVAAYEVDYAEPNHQKEYDALWNEHFEPNGFHRAILIGFNPKKEENNFTLIVPSKADFNNPMPKEVRFSLQQ